MLLHGSFRYKREIGTHTLGRETPGMIRGIDKEFVVITQFPDTER